MYFSVPFCASWHEKKSDLFSVKLAKTPDAWTLQHLTSDCAPALPTAPAPRQNSLAEATQLGGSHSPPHVLHASLLEPSAPRPTRFPGGFGRGANRAPELPPPPIDSSTDGLGYGSPPPAVSSPLDGGNRVGALRDRLQETPTLVREKAVDLRDDVQDRVHDIRVRDASI